MSDSVMYPEAGRWVNSYLVGANAYKIMSTPEEAQQLLLDDSGDFLQTGTERRAQVFPECGFERPAVCDPDSDAAAGI